MSQTMVQVVAGILGVILIAIIILRRKSKKKQQRRTPVQWVKKSVVQLLKSGAKVQTSSLENKHDFVYDNGVFNVFNPFPSAYNTAAQGISDNGQIVGSYCEQEFAQSLRAQLSRF